MAKKKKNNLQVFFIASGVLIAVLAVYLVLGQSDKGQSAKAAIDQALQRSTLPERTKEMQRILLSASDYASKNNDSYPTSLSELVPEYFDSIPVDPNTGKPFEYRLVDNTPVLGSPEDMVASATKTGKGDKAGKASPDEVNEAEQKALIASLNKPESANDFIYDSSGKRDPFRPYSMVPEKDEDDENKTELEKYTIGQLKLTTVMYGMENPLAIVENSQGIGFTVSKGTKIGTAGGEVIEIQKDRILILEETEDFTGDKKTRTIEMRLRLNEDE